MRTFILFLLAIAIQLSCKKSHENGTASVVGIYLLKSFQVVSGKCQIDPSTAVLQDTAAIKNADILEYSKSTHRFKLSPLVLNAKMQLPDFAPFAVAVDKQVIYYGFSKPATSNSSCSESITMDVGGAENNTINVNFGYPDGAAAGISDERNDARLLSALQQQGKLRD